MDYKQEAQKIVEMFYNEIDSMVYVDGCNSCYECGECYAKVGDKKKAAIRCAIKHVEELIRVTGFLIDNEDKISSYHWYLHEIINQLKQM